MATDNVHHLPPPTAPPPLNENHDQRTLHILQGIADLKAKLAIALQRAAYWENEARFWKATATLRIFGSGLSRRRIMTETTTEHTTVRERTGNGNGGGNNHLRDGLVGLLIGIVVGAWGHSSLVSTTPLTAGVPVAGTAASGPTLSDFRTVVREEFGRMPATANLNRTDLDNALDAAFRRQPAMVVGPTLAEIETMMTRKLAGARLTLAEADRDALSAPVLDAVSSLRRGQATLQSTVEGMRTSVAALAERPERRFSDGFNSTDRATMDSVNTLLLALNRRAEAIPATPVTPLVTGYTSAEMSSAMLYGQYCGSYQVYADRYDETTARTTFAEQTTTWRQRLANWNTSGSFWAGRACPEALIYRRVIKP